MNHNLNFGFMLQFTDEEIESAKAGEFDRELMKERIKEAMVRAYERPIWVHFKADPKLLRKAAKEILDGDPVLSFNLDTMAEEAINAVKNLEISEEDRWWRKD